MGQKIDRELHQLTNDDVTKILEVLPMQKSIDYKDTCIIDIRLFINYDFKEGNYGQLTLDFIL